jgi:hypothetical protein
VLQRRPGASDAAVDQACHHSHPFIVRLLLPDISIDLFAKMVLTLVKAVLHPWKHDDEATMKDARVTNSPSYPGTPRWVKVFVVIAFVAVVLFVVLHLTGGGIGHLIDHGMLGHGSRIGAPKQGAQP